MRLVYCLLVGGGVLAATKKARRAVTLGAMTFPRTRNVDAPGKCAFCADGTGVCGGGSRSHWEKSVTTDETHGAYYVDPPTRILTGGFVEVAFAFENVAIGGGVVTLELCSNPQYPTLDENCFEPLDRDPWDQSLSPFIPQYPHLFFLPDRHCMRSGFQARFQIPSNVTSPHAILRWQYQQPEICNPLPTDVEAQLSIWQAPRGKDLICHIPIVQQQSCGEDCPNKNCQGRVYRNCADVVIVESFTNQTELVFPSTRGASRGASRGSGSAAARRIPVVSSRNYEVEVLNIAPEEDTDYCGKDFQEKLSKCQQVIQDGRNTKAGYCESKCHLVATDPSSSGFQWCVNNGVCDLTECVASFYSDVCLLAD